MQEMHQLRINHFPSFRSGRLALVYDLFFAVKNGYSIKASNNQTGMKMGSLRGIDQALLEGIRDRNDEVIEQIIEVSGELASYPESLSLQIELALLSYDARRSRDDSDIL